MKKMEVETQKEYAKKHLSLIRCTQGDYQLMVDQHLMYCREIAEEHINQFVTDPKVWNEFVEKHKDKFNEAESEGAKTWVEMYAQKKVDKKKRKSKKKNKHSHDGISGMVAKGNGLDQYRFNERNVGCTVSDL